MTCGWEALDQTLWMNRSNVLLARTVECVMQRPGDGIGFTPGSVMTPPFLDRFLDCAVSDTHSSTAPTRCTSLARSTMPAFTWGSIGVRVGYLFHSNRFSCLYAFDAGTPTGPHGACNLDDVNAMNAYVNDWVDLRKDACEQGKVVWWAQATSPLNCCHKSIDDVERIMNMFYLRAAQSNPSPCLLSMTETQINAYWTSGDVVGIFYADDTWRSMAQRVQYAFQTRVANRTLPLVKMSSRTLPGVCDDDVPPPNVPPPNVPPPIVPPPNVPPPNVPPPNVPPPSNVQLSLTLGLLGTSVPLLVVFLLARRYGRTKVQDIRNHLPSSRALPPYYREGEWETL